MLNIPAWTSIKPRNPYIKFGSWKEPLQTSDEVCSLKDLGAYPWNSTLKTAGRSFVGGGTQFITPAGRCLAYSGASREDLRHTEAYLDTKATTLAKVIQPDLPFKDSSGEWS